MKTAKKKKVELLKFAQNYMEMLKLIHPDKKMNKRQFEVLIYLLVFMFALFALPKIMLGQHVFPHVNNQFDDSHRVAGDLSELTKHYF